jgi:hypothetical protein
VSDTTFRDQTAFRLCTKTSIARLLRLRFLLGEMSKPFDRRSAEMAEIAPRGTMLSMNFAAVGKYVGLARMPFAVQCFDLSGLTAFDPWFQGEGLGPAVVSLPLHDVLDIDAIMLRDRRVGRNGPELADFFGLDTDDWAQVNSPDWYWERRPTVGIDVLPEMVIERLDAAVRHRYGLSLEEIGHLEETVLDSDNHLLTGT